MEQSEDNKFIPMTSVNSGKGQQLRDNLFYYTNQIVNVIFYGKAGEPDWVMIDAGMPKCGKEIIEVAEKRFGGLPPKAVILTHGHFDHVGGIAEFLKKWKVPVYAHELEQGFLNGTKDYPKPDPSVEGGLMAKMSALYPHESTNIAEVLNVLPEDGSVPFMDGWNWLFTPGHTPGHISLYNDKEKILIAGDAFVTVRTDSLYRVLVQKNEVNGPPRYFTTDWKAARESVVNLQKLNPDLVITGHGEPMHGAELEEGLKKLVDDWNSMALPSHGKYV